MRELKFRAWHKGYAKSTIRAAAKPAMIYEEKPGDCFKWLNDGQPVFIMQYTGLKDKNGVEIYEDDILEHVESKNRINIYYNPVVAGFNPLHVSEWHTEALVIGNIYENLELLS